MKLLKKIKLFHEHQAHVRVTRAVTPDTTEKNHGYIVAFSKDFVVLQLTPDFRVDGYLLFPMQHLKKVKQTRSDEFTDRVLTAEGEKAKIDTQFSINLESWTSLFDHFQKTGQPLIMECEDPELDRFNLGPVIRHDQQGVFLRYLNADGTFAPDHSKFFFHEISKVQFDDRYLQLYGKYSQQPRTKS